MRSSRRKVTKMSSMKTLRDARTQGVTKLQVEGRGVNQAHVAGVRFLPSLPPCEAQHFQVLTHLWDLLVQRVLPDPPAQAALALRWGLPFLEAHLFQGALGAQVCLEMPSCAQVASGPGGRQVWLQRTENKDVHEGG